jgi:hypothetical protein
MIRQILPNNNENATSTFHLLFAKWTHPKTTGWVTWRVSRFLTWEAHLAWQKRVDSRTMTTGVRQGLSGHDILLFSSVGGGRMQLVSSAISCRYVWMGVASHLLTHRNTAPFPSLPLGWQELRAPAPDMRVGSLGACVCGLWCWRAWVLCFPFLFISFFYEHKYH